MRMHVRGGLMLAVLSLTSFGFSVAPASAQLFSRGCKNCQRPANHCNCRSQQPVMETQMVPQQVTTMRNEVVTQYRQEAFTQNVPVTTYRDVTVDEGGFQTVYVPKQVTKRIPQVSYQSQVAYRSVPYQVTRQVPQVVTQMVAQPTVRYQPQSYQAASVPVYQVAPVAVAPCGPCGGMAFAPVPIYQTAPIIGQPIQNIPVISAPINLNPVTMLPPNYSVTTSISQPVEADSHSAPVPDPKFLDSPGAARDAWTTVGARSGGRSETNGSGASQTTSNSGVRFKPARTVFQTWESQSRFAAGDGPERR